MSFTKIFQTGDYDFLEWIILNYPPEEFASGCALTFAVYSEHDHILKQLLNTGIDINIRDTNGETCFALACKKSRCNVIEFLLDFPDLNVNRRLPDRHAPLYDVCETMPFDVIKKFIDHPNMNMSRLGYLPNRCKDVEVLKLFLARSDFNRNPRGKIYPVPLFLMMKWDDCEDAVEMFINDPSTDVNVRNYRNENAIDVAQRLENPKLVDIITACPRFDPSL